MQQSLLARESLCVRAEQLKNSIFFSDENTWANHLLITPTSSIAGSIPLLHLREYFGYFPPQNESGKGMM